MIQVFNFNITGDCSNTGSGAVSFDITGTTPTVAPFSITDATGQGLLPLSAATLTYTVTGLTGGTYYATIADSSSEKVVQNIYISTGTTATIDSTAPSCGLDNGVITGFTSAVYGNSTFELYDGDNNYITSAITPTTYYEFTNLSAGTYYIVANDGGGCTGITSSVILTTSTGFTFGGYVVDDASCIGSGSGKIFITGLTPPVSAYTINWSSNVGSQTGTTVTGLTGGTYIVSIENPSGCTGSQSFFVNTVAPLESAGFITMSQPSCFANDGEVEFLIANGTAPYFFSGSSGQVEITFDTSVTFTGLSSGAYSFLVTDAGLCTIYDSVSLITPNSFSTVAINTTNSFCSSNDGSIQVLVDNGLSNVNNLLITISGSTGIQQSGTIGNPNQTFNGLPNGNYLVTVTSAGCTYTATTTISSTNLYSATTAVTGTTCGSNNGRIEVTVSTGGTLPYQFTLTGPTGPNPSTINNPVGVFTNLKGGNYTLTVQDSGVPTCVQSFTIYVDVSDPVYFDLFPSQPLNGNDGSIKSFIYLGEPPFNLIWSGGSVNGYTGSTVTGLTADTYSLTCTDASGCSLTKSVILTGTKKYVDYRYYTICEEQFFDSGLVQKKSIRSMYLEGFNDLTSGDTNCIINSADFTIYAEVGGQSAQTEFYTSTGTTDYPSDTVWADAIVNILEDFVGISGVTVDIISNRITITAACEDLKKNCGNQPINPLQDSEIKVNLLIDYDISCVSCS